ncbi:hypothetical protein DICVIV_07567 [Dictyocaulus viviparus]|uniref:Uncharacterized protein n=1 Tax=Dictyocaulus viviparus TaxID=29172 RepID=A0A0D8XRH9_DICVI|nr:hypothetical protein DICVIV_07567 [Dictyocaulus viviparus]
MYALSSWTPLLCRPDFGERLFLRDRGACFCESGTFICDLPEEMPEFYAVLLEQEVTSESNSINMARIAYKTCMNKTQLDILKTR